MIGVGLLDYVNRAAPNGVDAFASWVVGDVVHAFGDRRRLQFLAGVGVEDNNLSAAATYEETLMLLVECHGNVIAGQFHRPRGNYSILPAIHNFNLVARSIIQIE